MENITNGWNKQNAGLHELSFDQVLSAFSFKYKYVYSLEAET